MVKFSVLYRAKFRETYGPLLKMPSCKHTELPNPLFIVHMKQEGGDDDIVPVSILDCRYKPRKISKGKEDPYFQEILQFEFKTRWSNGEKTWERIENLGFQDYLAYRYLCLSPMQLRSLMFKGSRRSSKIRFRISPHRAEIIKN